MSEVIIGIVAGLGGVLLGAALTFLMEHRWDSRYQARDRDRKLREGVREQLHWSQRWAWGSVMGGDKAMHFDGFEEHAANWGVLSVRLHTLYPELQKLLKELQDKDSEGIGLYADGASEEEKETWRTDLRALTRRVVLQADKDLGWE